MSRLTPRGQRESVRTRYAILFILFFLASLVSYKVGERSGRHQGRVSLALRDVKFEEQENKSLVSLLREDRSHPLQTCPPVMCPPCDCNESPPPPKKKKRRAPRPHAASPVDRQKLLAWVRRFSPRLKRCRDAGQPIYRLHAVVKLSANKDKILSARVRGTDVPSAALRCVESDIKRWPAPKELVESHPPKLIFSLQLN